MLPISVCIIAKNEEKRIEKCLQSLVPYDFEIVLVDTGSTDRTVEIAANYTKHIYDFTWCDDFSAARNFSLEKASNEFIFMMDCDEWITSIDAEEMIYFIQNLGTQVGVVTRQNMIRQHVSGSDSEQTNYVISGCDQTERLFSRKLYHYVGLIHEQLSPIEGQELPCLLLQTTIGHSGYDMTDEEKTAKAVRNGTLLEKELLVNPNDPYLYYQLGKNSELMGEFEKALTFYLKGMEFQLDPTLAYVEAMVIRYGSLLLQLNKKEDALQLEGILELFPDSADFTYLMGCIYKQNQMFKKAVEQLIHAVKFEHANLNGANSFLAYHMLGEIMEEIGNPTEASSMYEIEQKLIKSANFRHI
ncbi:MAG: glycosyltransferase [Lachnospiraceae bacterium]|nr:glycosyltransferase [Lachnospiraceae bacterium]